MNSFQQSLDKYLTKGSDDSYSNYCEQICERFMEEDEEITLEDLELYDYDMAILDESKPTSIYIDIDDEQ